MAPSFGDIAFTPAVQRQQSKHGSRARYARMAEVSAGVTVIGAAEAAFIESRDSFYMATVGETGWPYIQHRGGPPGFLKVLDRARIGFVDLRGNRQYISVGNLTQDDRVSLFLIDYPSRRRLKLLGRAALLADDADLIRTLTPPATRALVERAIVITVEAFDWNCPQHITQRFTLADIATITDPLHARIATLEAALAKTSA